MDDSISTNATDQIDGTDEQADKLNLNNQDDKNVKLSSLKPPYSKANNAISKLPVPIILKRSRQSTEKSDGPESNENIDENKKEIESHNIVKEATQRSSNRKKIKKSFGSDFLDMDDGQYSNARYVSKKQRSKDCSYCLKNDGEIHHCKYCRVKGHETCFQANLGVSREGYKNKVVICKSCRTNCEICDKTDRAGELFFCSRCSSVFHKFCDANLNRLSRIVFGEWQCSFCDTLDSLVGDSLTEEQRKKEINRRKLLALRRRLRKSDYILEDGLCSIQQVVKQAVRKRRIGVDQANLDSENKIELSDDELDTSKYILNETQQLDFWSEDNSIDYNRLEDFLKKQRKNHNILSKHIKEDKKYYLLVKVFVDQLKEDKFDCKRSNFLRVLNSDLFKRSFFEHNTLNGLTKGSTFLEGLTKCIEKCVHTEYWKTDHVDQNSIGQNKYFTDQIDSKKVKEEKTIDYELEKATNDKEKKNSQPKVQEESVENRIVMEQKEDQNRKIDDNANDEIESMTNDSESENLDENPDHLNQYRMHLEEETFSPENEQIEESNDLEDDLKCNEPNLNDDSGDLNKLNVKENPKDAFKEIAVDEAVQKTVDENSNNDLNDFKILETKLEESSPADDHPSNKESNQSDDIEESNSMIIETVADQLAVVNDSIKVDLSKDNLIEESVSDNERCELICDEIIIEKTDGNNVNKSPNANESKILENSNDQTEQTSDELTEDKPVDQTTNQSDELTKNTKTSEKSNDETNERTESNRSNDTNENEIKRNDETDEQVADELQKVESSDHGSNSSSTSESRSASQNSQKGHKSMKFKTNKLSANKKLKTGKKKLKIKPSNNLVDKLFKRACKYNLNLLEPKHWTSEDVSIYMKQIGFENEAQCFKTKSIDGKALLKLSRQEILKNFGMKLGIAVKLFAYVHDLQIKNRCNITFD